MKLGYGGTKSEMERLMRDAEKLTGEHYTVGDFGDTVKAIHAVQKHLGITGTTAKEAATTLSGSFNSMKAAAQDFIGNLALGKRIGPSLQNLASTTKTFLTGNLFPMIQNIFNNLPQVFKGLGQGISAVAPDIIQGVVNLASSAASALIQAVPQLTNAAIQLIGAIAQALTKVDWGAVGGQIISAIGKGFQTNAPATIALLAGIGIKGGKGIIKGFGAASKAFDFLKGIPGEVNVTMQAFKTLGSVGLQGLKGMLSGVGGAFKALGAAMMANPFATVVIGITALVIALVVLYNKSETFRNFVNGAMAAIKSGVLNFVSGVKAAFSGLAQGFVNIWNGIKTVVTTVWNAIKTVIATVIGGIAGTISTSINTWKTIITTVLNAIKAVVTTVWNGIKTVTTTVWNGIKNAVLTVWNGIKVVVTGSVNAIKSVVGNVWNGIKSATSTVWNGIKTVIGSAINGAKAIINKFRPRLPNINNPVASLVGWVSGAINKARNIINKFRPKLPKLSFPHINLPHFSVSGGKAPYGIGGKGSLPSFHVSWYKKAMDNGMILNNPTIFGAAGGHLLGAGEAGPEAVVGAKSLYRMVQNAAASAGSGGDITVNVYAQPGQDVNQVADAVVDKIVALRRKAVMVSG